jgi:hypothetical protein
VIDTLISSLASDDDRRMACLILNNLSIPFENKQSLVQNDDLLEALLRVIQRGDPESYLCISCLMNLSVLEDAKVKIITFSPPDNSTSLLKTLELVLSTYSHYVFRPQLSVEREAVRYTIGLIRHLTTLKTNAILLSQTTDIPRLLLYNFIRDSPNPLARWKPDSVEDFSLLVMLNLAQCPRSLRFLRELDAEEILAKFQDQEGIHGMRAATIVFAIQTASPNMVSI